MLEASDLPAPQLYRTVATGVLVTALTDQGDIEAAEAVLERFAPGQSARAPHAVRCCCSRAGACARPSAGGRGPGRHARRRGHRRAHRAISPASLAWRSDAALVSMALGERDRAERLARGELGLARTFAAPRALGWPCAPRGWWRRHRGRGRSCARPQRRSMRRARRSSAPVPSSTSGRCCGGPTAAPTRASCCARASTRSSRRGGGAGRPGRDRAARHGRQAAARAPDRARRPAPPASAGSRSSRRRG